MFVKRNHDQTKASSEFSIDMTSATSLKLGDSFSVLEQNFEQLNPVSNKILTTLDPAMTDNAYNERSTSNPISISSKYTSENNSVRTQTVDMIPMLDGNEVELIDQLTSLSVSTRVAYGDGTDYRTARHATTGTSQNRMNISKRNTKGILIKFFHGVNS